MLRVEHNLEVLVLVDTVRLNEHVNHSKWDLFFLDLNQLVSSRFLAQVDKFLHRFAIFIYLLQIESASNDGFELGDCSVNALANDDGLLNHFFESCLSLGSEGLFVFVFITNPKTSANEDEQEVGEDKSQEDPHEHHDDGHLQRTVPLTSWLSMRFVFFRLESSNM